MKLRRAILTVHIVASVGLLGDVAAVLAVNVRAATAADAEFASASYDLLQMFSVLFGIPFSFVALATGIALGLGSKWGIFRYAWVTAKLALLLSVILVGAFVIGPATDEMRAGGGDAETVLVAAAAWDVLALTVATALSVYKPRRSAGQALSRRSSRSAPRAKRPAASMASAASGTRRAGRPGP